MGRFTLVGSSILSAFLSVIFLLMSSGRGWVLDLMFPLGICFLSASLKSSVNLLFSLCGSFSSSFSVRLSSMNSSNFCHSAFLLPASYFLPLLSDFCPWVELR